MDNTIFTVEIDTGYQMTGNDKQNTFRQIESAALCLASLFRAVKNSAVCLAGDGDVQYVADDLRCFAAIGSGVSLSIWKAIQSLENTSEETGSNNTPEKVVSIYQSKTDSLASQMSDLLKNPHLPPIFYDALKTAINDVHNTINQSELVELEDSPQYLEILLRGLKKGERN